MQADQNKRDRVVAFLSDKRMYEDVQNGMEESLRKCHSMGLFPHPEKAVRFKLPTDRDGHTHKVHLGSGENEIKIYIQTGHYTNGQLGEVFLKADKQGSLISGLMDALSMMISVGLQYGVPVSLIVEKLKNTRFEPQGVVRNGVVSTCTSVIDYTARWLEARYVGGDRYDGPARETEKALDGEDGSVGEGDSS